MMSPERTHGARTRRTILLFLASAALAAPAVAAQTPRAGGIRARCTNCDASDSAMTARELRHFALTIRYDSLRAEFERRSLTDGEREVLERELALTIRQLRDVMDEQRASASARSSSRATSAARVEAVRVGPGEYAVAFMKARRPGYLGVSFEGANSEYQKDDEHLIRFYQYPRIALVEPASPAERAGIVAGDTLLALNDMDVLAGEISLTRILVPEKRLNVMIRRDGSSKVVPVTVGRAPEYVVRRGAPMEPLMEEIEARRRSVAERGRVEAMPMPDGGTRVGSSSASGWVYTDGVGGARLHPVNAGLARALDVSSGVLVLTAPAGSPAHESGLREGDVIRRIAGQDVTTVRQAMELLRVNRGSPVRITIIRDRKSREITLNW